VFGGTANKRKSEKYNLCVWLCPPHHNMSGEGVHFCKDKQDELHRFAQKKFEEAYSHELFMKEFHKNYL